MSNTLTIWRRDDTDITLTFTNNGLPYPLTNASIFFTAKVNKTDLDVDAIIQVKETGITNTTGIFVFPIPRSKTDVPAASYFYDFQLVMGGKTTTLFDGTLIVKQDITIDIT